MTDDNGKDLLKAPPGYAVEIKGLKEIAEGGEIFFVVNSEGEAKNIAQNRNKAFMFEKESKVSKIEGGFAKLKFRLEIIYI